VVLSLKMWYCNRKHVANAILDLQNDPNQVVTVGEEGFYGK